MKELEEGYCDGCLLI